jgi:hypothetical protein
MKNNVEKTGSRLDRAEKILYPAITSLGFAAEIIGSFLKHVRINQEACRNLSFSVDGGAKKQVNSGSLSRHFLKSDTQMFEVMITLTVCTKADPLIEGDLQLITARNHLNKSVLTSPELKAQRKILRNGMDEFFGVETDDQWTKERKRSTIKYWRNSLELFRMDLHASGKHSYPVDIKHVDLFLKILESKN